MLWVGSDASNAHALSMDTPTKHGKGHKQVTHDHNMDTFDLEMHDREGHGLGGQSGLDVHEKPSIDLLEGCTKSERGIDYLRIHPTPRPNKKTQHDWDKQGLADHCGVGPLGI